MHIDTIDWSCFGLSCQWSGDNDSVLCRSTETRVVVPNGKAKIVPLKSYWLFWVLQEHGQSFHKVLLLHISWGMSSVVQFCSLGGFCLCMYMHMQVHIKKCGQVHSYTFYMHKAFFIERQTVTLKSCYCHWGYQDPNWGRVILVTDWLPMQKHIVLF